MGYRYSKAFLLQKKMIRIITGSEYRAHIEPLFKASEFLTIPDLFNLKLLKFYYKLSYQFLPKYFNGYLDVIRADVPYNYTLRQAARPLIRLSRVRHVFAQSTVLYQLIKLINETHNTNPKILEKIDQKSHTLQDLASMLHKYICKTTILSEACKIVLYVIYKLRYLLESHLSCYEAELYANI